MRSGQKTEKYVRGKYMLSNTLCSATLWNEAKCLNYQWRSRYWLSGWINSWLLHELIISNKQMQMNVNANINKFKPINFRVFVQQCSDMTQVFDSINPWMVYGCKILPCKHHSVKRFIILNSLKIMIGEIQKCNNSHIYILKQELMSLNGL